MFASPNEKRENCSIDQFHQKTCSCSDSPHRTFQLSVALWGFSTTFVDGELVCRAAHAAAGRGNWLLEKFNMHAYKFMHMHAYAHARHVDNHCSNLHC